MSDVIFRRVRALGLGRCESRTAASLVRAIEDAHGWSSRSAWSSPNSIKVRPAGPPITRRAMRLASALLAPRSRYIASESSMLAACSLRHSASVTGRRPDAGRAASKRRNALRVRGLMTAPPGRCRGHAPAWSARRTRSPHSGTRTPAVAQPGPVRGNPQRPQEYRPCNGIGR